MADGGKGGIVRLRAHGADLAAQGQPEQLGFVQLGRQGALGGGDDDFGPPVEVGVGVLDPGQLFAGNGMGGNKAAQA